MKFCRTLLLKRFLFIVLISITITSCQKEISSELQNPRQNNTPIDFNTAGKTRNITAYIQGKIFNEEGKPLGNATITAGGKSVTTSANGYFSISNVIIDQKFAFIKVEKQGYYTGTRTFVSAQNDSNYLEVKLISKTLEGNINTTSGGSVEARNGGSVSLPANAVIDAVTKQPYNGRINVYAYRLNPLEKDFSGKMPGDLRGIRTDGSESAMISYGMMVVELESESGQKLQIAPGKQATINLPVSAGAPDSIPLWWFDENRGLWIEEGVGHKIGNNYVGNVAHFTFWNCDVPAKMAYFKAQLVDINSNPLSYVQVRMSTERNGEATGFTNANGFVAGWVPKNTTLSLTVMDNCENSIFAKTVSAITDSFDIGTLVIPDAPRVIVNGTALNCSAQNIVSGVAYLDLDSLRYKSAIRNGQYMFNILSCANASLQGTVYGVDYGTLKQSAVKQVTLYPGNNTISPITACDVQLDEFMKIEFQGTTSDFLKRDFHVSITNNTLEFNMSWDTIGSRNPSIYVAIDLNTYANSKANVAYYFYSQWNDNTNGYDYYTYDSTLTQCVFTQWSTESGQIISGSFEGPIKKRGDTNASSIKISFSIRRP